MEKEAELEQHSAKIGISYGNKLKEIEQLWIDRENDIKSVITEKVTQGLYLLNLS